MRRWLLIILTLWAAGARAEEPSILEPSQAFKFSARQISGTALEIVYDIAPGYYLYREKFKFAAEGPDVKLGSADIPHGKVKQDEFFGKVETLRDKVSITLPFKGTSNNWHANVTSQGCADVGVCFPPNTEQLGIKNGVASVTTPGDTASGFAALDAAAPSASQDQLLNTQNSPRASAPASAAPAATENDRMAQLFKSKNFWGIVAFFFVAGLLLSFTPCVLPMIPILSGLIVGQGAQVSKGRSAALSIAYVLGMAVTYAIAGIFAGLSGSMLSNSLQTPWVLSVFALVFVALAMSMFGFYELQMPASVQNRLTSKCNQQQGGKFVGVTLMGVLSALIVGPCVAAPLAGALGYISQSRDVVLGGTALFVMALGMGVPLLAVGFSAGSVLPKAGPWMDAVKRFFGVMLLALAVWIITPVIPAGAVMLLWALLLVGCAMFLRAIDPLPVDANGMTRLFKGVGIVSLVGGVALLIGALSGARDPLQPLAGLKNAASHGAETPLFQRVKSTSELDQRLANTNGKYVLLDFYADWCVSCKEMERYTFADEKVRANLKDMILLQADVTANNKDDAALLKRFGLFGPPGLILFDPQGREVPSFRVIGYQDSEEFLQTLKRAHS